MYKFKKNFLCAGILGCLSNVILDHTSNVILKHTSNVILGFIPRIHAKQNSNRYYRACLDNLDPRVEPEDDNRMRMFFKPEYDYKRSLIKGLNVVCQCAALLERRVQSSTRVRKAQAVTRQTNPIGRSMIEMLGVLAIVGVLSIGGIAGYSKAMNMYKINRWSAYYTELLANLQIAFSTTGTYGDKSEDLTNTVISAGLMPEGMVDANHKDIFGNRVYVLSRDWGELYGVRLNIQYNMQAGKAAVDCCNKLFEMGQLYPNLWIVWISETDYGVCGGGAPDSYIRDMGCVRYNKAAVASNCKICESQACSILTLLNNSVY